VTNKGATIFNAVTSLDADENSSTQQSFLGEELLVIS